MRSKNTLHTRKLFRSVAAIAAFGLLASTAHGALAALTTNPDFDSDTLAAAPSVWVPQLSGGTGVVDDTYANSGSQSLLIDSTGAGQWATPNFFQEFEGVEGNTYNLQGYMRIAAPVAATNLWGTLKIEFYDSANVRLEPDQSLITEGQYDNGGGPFPGVVSLPYVGNAFGSGDNTASGWVFTEAEAVAPVGTATVRFFILNVNGSNGAIWYDDIQGSEVITNLITNGGFEADVAGTLGVGTSVFPTGWTGGSVDASLATVSTDYAQAGVNSLLIDTTPIGGTWASPNFRQEFPAIPGDEFYMSGYIYNPGPLVANVWGTYKIEFFDGGGNNLQPASISPGNLDGAGQPFVGAVSDPLVGDVFGGGDQTLNTWIFSEVGAVAPAGTVGVRLVLLNVNGNGAPFYYDSIVGFKLSDGAEAKIPVIAVSLSGDALTVTIPTETGVDYEAYKAPDLSAWTATGITAVGTGSPVSLTVPGSAPGFVRIETSDAPVTTPDVGDCIIQDPDLDAPAWTGFAAITGTSGTATDYFGGIALADAPWEPDTFGGATFGMNNSFIAGNPDYAGASQVISIKEEYIAPENTFGGRPLIDLGGKQLVISGFVQTSETYAAGNSGEVFVLALSNDGSWGAVAQASVDINVDDLDGSDGTFMNTSTGEFSVGLNIPGSGLNMVQVGFRNSGILGTAGEMTISDVNVCVADPIDLAPHTGEVLLNPDFTDTGNGSGEYWEVGIDATLNVSGANSFSAFTAGAEVQPMATFVDGVSATFANAAVPDLISDQNWQGIELKAGKFQQVIGVPGGGAGAQQLNLYGQDLVFTGNYTVNDYGAPANSEIKAISVGGPGASANGTVGVYLVGPYNGSLSGNPASFRVNRTGSGDLQFLNVTDGGNGSVVGDVYTIPSAVSGGGGDITVEVTALTGITLRIGIESLTPAFAVYNPGGIGDPLGSDYIDITAAMPTLGVPQAFSLPVTIDTKANQPLSLVQIVVQILGIEDTGGSVTVDNLSVIASDPL